MVIQIKVISKQRLIEAEFLFCVNEMSYTVLAQICGKVDIPLKSVRQSVLTCRVRSKWPPEECLIALCLDLNNIASIDQSPGIKYHPLRRA